MATRSSLVFYVNNRRYEVAGQECFGSLASFLREECRLTGTKIVCAEGDCGACTVLIGPHYKAVNSCILPLYLVDCQHVVTVEGLKNSVELHPIQKAITDQFGTQCGYCTPGFACSMAALVEDSLTHNKPITEKRAKNWMTGNLCRCTGYEPIIKAAQSISLSQTRSLRVQYKDDRRDLELARLSKQSMSLNVHDFRLDIPATLDEALKIKTAFPNAKLVAGATDIAVAINKRNQVYPHIVSLQNLGLSTLRKSDAWIEIGASITLDALEKFAEAELPEFGRLLKVFASPQIKNRGTLVGNVVNASPIGDTIPFLMISGAEIEVKNTSSIRFIPLDRFYLGYKTIDLKPEEIVTGIRIPVPTSDTITKLYKVSLRKDLDISVVTLGATIEIKDGKILQARLALGGVGPTVLRLPALEQRWIGAKFERPLFERSGSDLSKLIAPISDVRGSREYRLKLSQNLLLKLHDEISGASP